MKNEKAHEIPRAQNTDADSAGSRPSRPAGFNSGHRQKPYEGDADATTWDQLGEFCSVDDLIEIIPVDRKTVYRMIRHNKIPGATRFGRKILLHTDTVYQWVTG